MTTISVAGRIGRQPLVKEIKNKRLVSIDLLRGAVMIVMALDHVRDYFHYDAFHYSPTDLTQTNVPLFFTRFITHYCAPVFVFLAGISAFLYGRKKSPRELSFFLFTRGLWLVFVELFILSLFRTFNPSYTYFNLQVIWAIGLCMIALSAMIHLDRRILLVLSFLLVAGHNLLDNVHAPGSFLWAVLHDPARFTFGRFHFSVKYPILPWAGIMALGYCCGSFYAPGYDPEKRKKIFLLFGVGALSLFVILRSGNFYGDTAHWSIQKNGVFTFMSFLNVTKYPPSLLYALITLGPAFIFLAFAERPLNRFSEKVALFGRVAMFYYLAHILLIHSLAVLGVVIAGQKPSDMILSMDVNTIPALKTYGFNLTIVYVVWIALILMLYPLCRWYDRYKRSHINKYPLLSYL